MAKAQKKQERSSSGNEQIEEGFRKWMGELNELRQSLWGLHALLDSLVADSFSGDVDERDVIQAAPYLTKRLARLADEVQDGFDELERLVIRPMNATILLTPASSKPMSSRSFL